jgi:hypothetical protein
MTPSERHEFFERLLVLRALDRASDVDRQPVISVADAIRYAEAVLTAVELDREPRPADPGAVEFDHFARQVEAAARGREWPAPFPRRHPSGPAGLDPFPPIPPFPSIPPFPPFEDDPRS